MSVYSYQKNRWKYLTSLLGGYISVPSKYILGDFHNKVGLHILIRMFHSPNICQAISVLSTQGKQTNKQKNPTNWKLQS